MSHMPNYPSLHDTCYTVDGFMVIGLRMRKHFSRPDEIWLSANAVTGKGIRPIICPTWDKHGKSQREGVADLDTDTVKRPVIKDFVR